MNNPISEHDLKFWMGQSDQIVEHLQRMGVYDDREFNQDLAYLKGVRDSLPNPQVMNNIINRLECLSWIIFALASSTPNPEPVDE